MSTDIVSDLLKEVLKEVVKEAVKEAVKEIEAAKEVADKYKEENNEEKKAVIKEYHELFVKLLKACGQEDETGLFGESEIYEAACDVVSYYNQHKAVLDVNGLEKYNKEIIKRMEPYEEGSLTGNEEFIELVKKAKTVLAKMLL